MSTLWEMATTIRAERPERVARAAALVPQRKAAFVDLDEPARIDYWCRLLGTTPWRLCCAIDHVGNDPTAIRRYLGRKPAQAQRLAVRSA